MKRETVILACLLVALSLLAARLHVQDRAASSDLVQNTGDATRHTDVVDHATIPPPKPAELGKEPIAEATVARREVQRAIIAPSPIDSRPVDQIRFWRQHAATGNPYAGCRFAVASAGCASLRSAYASWARDRVLNARTPNGESIGDDCSGVTDADVQGRFDALLGAAQRGHTPSALLFAMGGGMSALIPAPEEIRAFRTHAPRLAWQAFDAGDSDAALLLWRAYNRVDGDIVALSSVIDPDPIKAHALDHLMGDLVPNFVVGTAAEAGLSNDQAAQAAALHAEWRATAFSSPMPPRYGMQIETMFELEKRAVDLCAPAPL